MTEIETYYESAEGVTITSNKAKREVEDHGCDWIEFKDDFGDQETYVATSVLSWLGY